jgi:hypothetical protein
VRPHPRVSAALGAVLCLVATAACASSSQGSTDLFGERGSVDKLEVKLEVTNNNGKDATLHSIEDGNRRRLLGTVTGKGTGSYTLPWRTLMPLQIEIDFLAGGRCTTRAITVEPGAVLDLQIGIDDSSACDVRD